MSSIRQNGDVTYQAFLDRRIEHAIDDLYESFDAAEWPEVDELGEMPEIISIEIEYRVAPGINRHCLPPTDSPADCCAGADCDECAAAEIPFSCALGCGDSSGDDLPLPDYQQMIRDANDEAEQARRLARAWKRAAKANRGIVKSLSLDIRAWQGHFVYMQREAKQANRRARAWKAEAKKLSEQVKLLGQELAARDAALAEATAECERLRDLPKLNDSLYTKEEITCPFCNYRYASFDRYSKEIAWYYCSNCCQRIAVYKGVPIGKPS